MQLMFIINQNGDLSFQFKVMQLNLSRKEIFEIPEKSVKQQKVYQFPQSIACKTPEIQLHWSQPWTWDKVKWNVTFLRAITYGLRSRQAFRATLRQGPSKDWPWIGATRGRVQGPSSLREWPCDGNARVSGLASRSRSLGRFPRIYCEGWTVKMFVRNKPLQIYCCVRKAFWV